MTASKVVVQPDSTGAAIQTFRNSVAGATVDAQAVVPVDTTGAAISPALDTTLTGGSAKAIARGGAKGATAAADITSTAQGADHHAGDVQIYHGGVAVNPTAIRALTSADVVTVNGGAQDSSVLLTNAALALLALAQGSTPTATAPGPLVMGLVNDAPQPVLDGTVAALSLTNDGRLRVSVSLEGLNFFSKYESSKWNDDLDF